MTYGTRELRKLWREHWEESANRHKAWAATGYRHNSKPVHNPLPSVLVGMKCGARNRKGEPCNRVDLELNGRCKFHGGRSTGPTSTEGIARARANLTLRWSEPLVNG
ncbi:HGGxSTG domain-containing protein [Sphingorhabdus contaminans]|uniref:Uncharacterized protein n=1 Tax=Sphingorhabdus contaminans TaxID=1343899 RepID=A0A553WIP6_9SPHN|nr:hypothetical protein FOM92_03885 [Sphingorhabdus contaminans]